MSKLRGNKVGSKSQGKEGSSMKIEELFKVQAERQISRSSSTLGLSESPYFSPEKKSNHGQHGNDGSTGRKLTKLSKRYRTLSHEETKHNEQSDTEKHVEHSTSKRKVVSGGSVIAENNDVKKPKLTSEEFTAENDVTELKLNSSEDNLCENNSFNCSNNVSGNSSTGLGDINAENRTDDIFDTGTHKPSLEKAATVSLKHGGHISLDASEDESASDELDSTDKEESKSQLKRDTTDTSNLKRDTTDTSNLRCDKPSPEPNTSKELHLGNDSKDQFSVERENDEADADEDDVGEFRIPYYFENFQVILKTVLEDEFYIPLFNEGDLNVVKKFTNLTENGQKLFIRLFQRKYRWLRKEKVSYPKIAEDLSEIFQELVKQGFILDERRMDALEDILVALPAPELKQLAKSLRLNASQQMSDLTQAILKHSRQTNISSFFMSKNKDGGTAAIIMNRAKALLGSCYKLSALERDVFIRAVMLFSLHQIDGDMDEASGGQTQLFQMLMTNIGRMVYPSYTVNKQTRIFRTRSEVIRFQKAVIMEDDIFEAMDKHHFEEAMNLYKSGYTEWKLIWQDKSITRHDMKLVEHLRMYTAGSVYARVLTYGVEVLQKKRLYKDAVILLEELLKQKVYQPSYRGRWYDRLALNLDQHLKQHSKALDVIKEALADNMVRFGNRYALFQRAQRICNSPSKKKLKNRWMEFMDDMFITVMEAPTVTIEGKLLTKNTQFAVYVTDEHPDQENEKTISKRVEDVALAHYRENGYPQGIHGEGSTFTFLLVLLMWSVFYDCDVPDTFLNPYHVFPLDVRTDHFYETRKEEIDNALELIRNSSADELSEKLGESWSKHEGVLSVNWERFESLEHAQGLVRCVGGHHLAAIMERMIKNMRFTHSGFPDLVVWNPKTLKYRISEVKGPGDRLSVKQILWLDYLVNFGIQAETCYVKAVGCKRLQTT